jgi:hypothetical protein
MKLTAERKAELLNELRLRVLFKDRALCRRFGISRRTLSRLQSEALDPFAEGLSQVLDRQMAQIEPDTLHVICFTSNMVNVPKRVKAV